MHSKYVCISKCICQIMVPEQQHAQSMQLPILMAITNDHDQKQDRKLSWRNFISTHNSMKEVKQQVCLWQQCWCCETWQDRCSSWTINMRAPRQYFLITTRQ